ncbi:MAG: hypothetical protein K6U04_11445 [Armatimonadetes bacterium]|nr:hypothetical protein [Armatimonadota bacterium]
MFSLKKVWAELNSLAGRKLDFRRKNWREIIFRAREKAVPFLSLHRVNVGLFLMLAGAVSTMGFLFLQLGKSTPGAGTAEARSSAETMAGNIYRMLPELRRGADRAEESVGKDPSGPFFTARLKGVLIDPEKGNLAIIETPEMSYIVGRGGEAAGYRVVQITKDNVFLKSADRELRLELEEGRQ